MKTPPVPLRFAQQFRLASSRFPQGDRAGELAGGSARWRSLRGSVLSRRVAGRSWVVLAAWLSAVAALAALTPATQRLTLITWLVTAPGFEELFFRGVVHEALLRSAPVARTGHRTAVANAVTALLFGALHAWARGPWTGVAVVLPALVIGHQYAGRRSVLAAVALHSAFNLAWLAWSLPALEQAVALELARWPTSSTFFTRELPA